MKPGLVRDDQGRSPSAIAPLTFRRRFGDLNGDGRIDRFEVRAARKSVRSRAGEPAYLAALDLDGTGIIPRRSFRRVLREWLRRPCRRRLHGNTGRPS